MGSSNTPRSIVTAAALVYAIAAILVACIGCDVEPSQDFTISVEPQAATLREGQTVDLVASGGLAYSWSIGQNSTTQRWGILNVKTGDRVTYTSVHSQPGETNIQVLTVTSSIGDQDNLASNAVTHQASAEVYILHIP